VKPFVKSNKNDFVDAEAIAEAVARENMRFVPMRCLFLHGARAVLLRVKYDTGRLGQWARQLELRASRNKAIVAKANRLARIAWAVLAKGQDYRAGAVVAAA
jgi:transposase